MMRSQSGFTLIEVVKVIVILSILAVGSVQFISFSAQGYVDTVRRSELASTATIVNEKITRLVRDALPGSIRVTADQSCIEFIPVVGATIYIDAPFSSAGTTVQAVNLDSLLSTSGRLSIYPVVSSANDLYTVTRNPGLISTNTVTSSVAGDDITFTFSGGSSFQFEKISPQKRLYVVNQPQAFCQNGTQLFFYRNYGFVGDISNLAAALHSTIPNRLLVADKLLASSLRFSYQPASLRRNALVAYELELQDDTNLTETFVINQEVQVRNVP